MLTGNKRIVIVSSRYGSDRLGNCEVCDCHADRMFHLMLSLEYTKRDGSKGFTRSGGRSLFGHLECLEQVANS